MWPQDRRTACPRCGGALGEPVPERRQKWESGFPTKREAEAALSATLGSASRGPLVQPAKLTVSEYLRDEWLPSLEVRPSTLASYQHFTRAWVIPAVGHLRLDALTSSHVRDFERSLKGAPRLSGKGTIGDRTVQYIAVVFRHALKDAVRMGFLARSPADLLPRPSARQRQMRFWTPEQAQRFMTVALDDDLRAGWSLLLARGLRRGELLGLHWPEVDLEVGRMSITRTRVVVNYRVVESVPKTARGRRTIPLDETLVALLREHKYRQAEAGHFDPTGLVFLDEHGEAPHPQAIGLTFRRLAKRAQVPAIRLHDARHTCATIALRAGIPTRVVSEWLGHASTSITEDTYQHVIPSMMEEVGALVTELVFGEATVGGDAGAKA